MGEVGRWDQGGAGELLVIVDATAAVSGGGVYLRNLLANWGDDGGKMRVEVLHTPDLEPLSLRPELQYVKFQAVWLPWPAVRFWLLGSVYKLLWREMILPFHLWRQRPSVFFSNSGSIPILVPPGVKAVVAIHNSMPLQPELWYLERSWLRKLRLMMLRRQICRLYRRGVELIVFSEDLRDRLGRLTGSSDRCTVIRHGIEWGQRERELEVPSEVDGLELNGRQFLLYVSQLHRYKNVLSLLKAFRAVRALHPGVDLMIVGNITDRKYAQEIAAEIDSAGLNDQVHLIPGASRQSLISFYRNAIAVIYPSRAENCPFVLLEAMALGRSIAASNIPAIVETCGSAAIYFEPEDIAAMSKQMLRLISDPVLRRQLETNGIDRAAKLSWQVAASRTVNLIGQLAKRAATT